MESISHKSANLSTPVRQQQSVNIVISLRQKRSHSMSKTLCWGSTAVDRGLRWPPLSCLSDWQAPGRASICGRARSDIPVLGWPSRLSSKPDYQHSTAASAAGKCQPHLWWSDTKKDTSFH